MVELQEDDRDVQIGSSSHAHEDSFNADEDEDVRELLILYASQTGSAQDVAEFIAREAWRRHFSARVLNVQDFDKVKRAASSKGWLSS